MEAKNDTGIRVNGTWANRSRFKPVDLPDVGITVRLGLDPKGYINSCEILEAEIPPAKLSRERTITRLAVLKAAASFGASRRDLKSADVLKIAESWIAWIES